jgi:GTPase SAR1 family protein
MVSKKICVIGQFAVGKTSLVRRYVLDEFSHDYQATLGVNIYKYSDTVDYPASGESTLNQIIWDIEGGDTNPEKTGTYIQGAAGALVVGNHRGHVGPRPVIPFTAARTPDRVRAQQDRPARRPAIDGCG